jgi:hypothetical protein
MTRHPDASQFGTFSYHPWLHAMTSNSEGDTHLQRVMHATERLVVDFCNDSKEQPFGIQLEQITVGIGTPTPCFMAELNAVEAVLSRVKLWGINEDTGRLDCVLDGNYFTRLVRVTGLIVLSSLGDGLNPTTSPFADSRPPLNLELGRVVVS